MDAAIALPSYSEQFLAGLGPAALVELMRGDHDRVPRSVIDACARHGDDMTAALQDMAEGPWSETDAPGNWWLRLHAVMVLGLIPSERAGLLLVRFMRRYAAASLNTLNIFNNGVDYGS